MKVYYYNVDPRTNKKIKSKHFIECADNTKSILLVIKGLISTGSIVSVDDNIRPYVDMLIEIEKK